MGFSHHYGVKALDSSLTVSHSLLEPSRIVSKCRLRLADPQESSCLFKHQKT